MQIANYLQGRIQCGFKFELFEPEGGENRSSAGSGVSPAQFILFINDLSLVIHHIDFFLFADDGKGLVKLKPQLLKDNDCMQSDINSICVWSKQKKLPVLHHRQTSQKHFCTINQTKLQ